LFWILGAGLLLSPTLHPRYLLWILPLAVLQGSRGWILATGLVLLAYWGSGPYQSTGVWVHPDAVRLLIWGPVLALLCADALRRLRTARGALGPPLHHPPDPAPQPPHREEEQEGH